MHLQKEMYEARTFFHYYPKRLWDFDIKHFVGIRATPVTTRNLT